MATDVYSAVLPSSTGDIIGSFIAAAVRKEIEGYIIWYSEYLSPFYAQLVAAKIDPVLAITLLLADGAPKPKQVGKATLKLQANASALSSEATDKKLGGSLGFTPAGIPLLAGLNAALSASTETSAETQTASQANSTLEIDILPVAGAAFLAAFVAAVKDMASPNVLPAFLPVPAVVPAPISAPVVKG